jgi:glycosyltransferase involved in cell wall biosynthesis
VTRLDRSEARTENRKNPENPKNRKNPKNRTAHESSAPTHPRERCEPNTPKLLKFHQIARGTLLAEMASVKLSPRIPVAVFLTRFEPGGTERQMIELIRRLDRARFTVHVACFHREGPWLPRVTECAASVTEFPVDGFARARTVAQLAAFARWCRREQIAVVHTCDLYANILGLPGARLAGVPVRIGSRRELNPDKTDGQIRLQRLAYRFATKVVANSSAARTILEREGLAPKSIAVIPNGVDAGTFTTRSPRATTQRRRTIITVANLRPEKGHETLIAAATLLARDFPDVRFQIVGEGPRRAVLESLVRARHLKRRVMFLGHREDVPALLADADVFVLPSRSEAFPNGAIEAMAAGLPVIAGAVGGLVDLIDHGRTGLLIEPDQPEQLAHAIGQLLTDQQLATRIGTAARTDVVQRYSFERMVTAFEDLYLASLRATAIASAHCAPIAES